MNKKEKAYRDLIRSLEQPGHKKEKKEFHAARRGVKAPASTVVQDKKKKQRSRASVKKQTRKEIFDHS